MKITKRQLRRIIKEEKARLLNEGLQSYIEQLYGAMENIGYHFIEQDDHSPESQAKAAQVLRDEVEGFIESALPDADGSRWQ